MESMIFRYSMLNTDDTCQVKTKLQYIDLVPEPGLRNANYVFGTAMHLALEEHFEGGDPQATFNMFWGSIKPEEYDWEGRYNYASYAEIGAELLRKWLKVHAKDYEPLYVEKQIEFTVGNIFTFTGKPDFIGRYRGNLSVVDWKTSAQTFDKRKGIVDGQTWLYAYAAKQKYDLDIEQVVYSPFIKYEARVQNPIVIPVTKAKLDDMLGQAYLKAKAIANRTEWIRNSQSCLRCPYFTHCYPEAK